MLHKKLFSIFMLIILIFSVFVFSSVWYVSYDQVINSAKSSYELIFKQSTMDFATMIETSKSDILNLASDETIQENLRSIYNSTTVSKEDYLKVIQNKEISNLYDMKYMYSTSTDYNRVTCSTVLYGVDTFGRCRQLNGIEEKTFSGATNYREIDEIKQSIKLPGDFIYKFVNEDKQYLKIYKAIYDTENWNTVIGIVCMRLSINDMISTILLPLKTEYNITANIVYQNNDELETFGTVPIKIKDNHIFSGDKSYITGESFYMERNITGSKFYVIGTVPTVDLKEYFYELSKILISIMILALFISFTFSLYISKKFTEPIVSLSDTMKEVQYGALDTKAYTDIKEGEIKELYDSFNYMLNMINELIEKNYINQIKQKQIELSALQSQINTHFLYNTMDTVNWLAKEYNADDISLIVVSLSSFLRISLSKGKNIIRLHDEVKHVSAYLDIQKIRYNNSFVTRINIDPNAENMYTIKMLLQPLVENAIYHGFEKTGIMGEIFINVRLIDDKIHIQVGNTGDNINLKEINDLIADINQGEENINQYGTKSIKQRLTLEYADKAQYFYTAQDGNTIANVIFPAYNEKEKKHD